MLAMHWLFSLLFGIIKGHTLTWNWTDSQCNINVGMEAISEYWRQGYVGVIGPGCTCDYEARLAGSINFPLFDYVSCNFFVRARVEALGKHALTHSTVSPNILVLGVLKAPNISRMVSCVSAL